MKLKSALLWVLLLMSTILQAQSSMGTDFWVSFLPNGTPNTSYDYYLSITLASKEASVVKLENEELGYSKTVTLAANSVEVVRVPYDDFNAQEYGEILNKTVHVTSTTPISVYAENFCWYSNDATLVLPVSACGSFYIAQSHVGRTKSVVASNGEYQPSTLSIIAFEDNTEVHITPSQTTTTGQEANVTYTITLNKGQVYQLGSLVSNNGRGLSGTKIQALNGKKVAVYTGNRCGTVPDATSPGDSDMLFDVDYPVSSWGKKFIVQPFKGDNYDMVRVTACKDGTAIYKNGTLLATIDALDSYEFTISERDGAFSVETSEPVALYQYMTGNAYLTTRSMGGPSFQYVPPVEQAIKEATFTTTTNSMVSYHYVNLVVKTEDVATITLDGKTGFATFTAVDDVYSSASVQMSAGIHTLASQSGFIGNVYGVGTNVSYSYALGSEIATINPVKEETTLPDNIFNPTCTVKPDASAFDIEEKFSVEGAHSMEAVLVGDIDGDSIPEILTLGATSTYQGFIAVKNLLVIDGKNQKLKYTIETPSLDVYCVKYTFADVDKDGKAEIFVLAGDMKIYCYTYDGTLKWTSSTLDQAAQLSVADVNADGTAELVVGHYIFDAQTGTLLLNGTMTANGTGFCSPHAIHLIGFKPFHMYGLYDFDKDGQLEMCAGNALYKINITNNAGTTGNSWEVLREMPANANIPYLDGETVVADFDNDGDADIIVVAEYQGGSATDSDRPANLYVWDGQTDELIAYADIPEAEYGVSAPFCGDINGDGLLELAVCRSNGMTVVNYSATEASHINFITKQNSKFKETSSFTAFDFNQDGQDEFVYRDDSHLSISDGKTFTDLSEPIIAYSGTMTEFPVVADVDGDGHAEIIITRADVPWDGNGNLAKVKGDVVVYGSKKPGAWSSARKVWNQYPYNVVNINEDLTVPTTQFDIVTKFANGKKPFNAVQKQLPYINENGDLFNLAADLTIVDKGHKVTATCNNLIIDTLIVENIGEIVSQNELTIKVTDIESDIVILNDTLPYNPIDVNKQDTLELSLPIVFPSDRKIKVEINPAGDRQQPECNYENNSIELLAPGYVEVIDSINDTICYLYDGTIKPDEHDTTYVDMANGCDHIIIKNTYYRPSYLIEETYSLKTDSTYNWRGRVLNETGVYYDSLSTKSGCDSVYVLRLIPAAQTPDNIFNPTCTVKPDASAFDIEEKFAISGVHSMTTPLVGDIDGDGDVEILAQQACPYSDGRSYMYAKNIMVIDGKTQEQKYIINTPRCDAYGTKITFADVDKDGKAEIFLEDANHYVYGYTYDGTQIWKSTSLDHSYQLSVADVNSDGTPELVAGHYIFDAKTGTLLVNGKMESTGTGYCSPTTVDDLEWYSWSEFSNFGFHLYGLYDFDKDGQLELCAGNTLYKINITNNSGTEGNSWSVLRQMEANDDIEFLDGETIVADFDNDGDADIIVAAFDRKEGTFSTKRDANFYVWDGQTDKIIAHANTASSSLGVSVPVASDINNDGKLEVAFNRNEGYYVVNYDETEEGNLNFIVYNDKRFGETSSFVAFDFNQDGKDELVYRDTLHLSICDGTTLENLSTPIVTLSGTIMESAIVADIDGDGHAEIICNRSPSPWTDYLWKNYEGDLVVYGSKKPGAWSSARKVWNQYPYNVVNINENLTVPTVQFDITTTFPNGKKPFNAVQKQISYLDENGDLFNLAADLTIADKGHKVRSACDSIAIDSLVVENIGEIVSQKELTIKVTDVDADTTIWNDTIQNQAVEVGKQNILNLKMPGRNYAGSKIKIEINPAGDRQQPECNYENNSIELEVPAFNPVEIVTHDTICIPFGIVLKGGYDQVDTSSNGCDSTFIKYIHFSQSFVSEEEQTICEGSTYTWQGRTLSEAGTYTDSLKTKAGCDSTLTLTLTVIPTKRTELTAGFCPNSTYTFAGKELTAAGTYSDTLKAESGCDSIVTLTLTVLPTYDLKEEKSICYGTTYTWEGKTLSESGTYIDTLKTEAGCDSIRTLTLTILPSIKTDLNISICNGSSYTLGDKTLTEAGTYTDTLIAVGGCDSIVTLNLTVLPTYSQTEEQTICEGSTYTWEGRTLSEAGIYTDSLKTKAGCDSTLTLTLTVIPTKRTELTAGFCPNSTYTFAGKELTAAGTYSDTLKAESGCDSIVTLTLNMLSIEHSEISDSITDLDTYNFGGKMINEPGTYTDTLKSVSGCDSIVTLNLYHKEIPTITLIEDVCVNSREDYDPSLPLIEYMDEKRDTIKNSLGQTIITIKIKKVQRAQFVDLEESICEGESYTFGGKKLTKSGIYGDTLRNSCDCCDSIITTLNLTVKKGATSEISDEICEGRDYTFNGNTASYESGVIKLTAVEPGANGCDSTTLLTLNVMPSLHKEMWDTIMVGESYNNYGFSVAEQTERGTFTYYQTIKNEDQCDSIITLNLIVNPMVDNKDIPTVFSPSNRDGVNDIFMKGYELYIYDRYGNLICKSDNGWDGMYRGEYADPGVYVYVITMKDGKKKKGTIEVLKD